MPGVAVYLDRAPHHAMLVAWGRAPDAWWACVQLRQSVRSAEATEELAVAAWVPAASVTRPGWSTPHRVPRLRLAADRTTWPAPPGWPSWYAGAWPAGPLALPPGCVPVTGPAWSRRR